MGEKVMMTLEGCSGAPSLAEAAERLHVSVEALDESFGVILVDPARGVFTVRVERSALEARGPAEEGVKGPYSDPRIGPFGRPE